MTSIAFFSDIALVVSSNSFVFTFGDNYWWCFNVANQFHHNTLWSMFNHPPTVFSDYLHTTVYTNVIITQIFYIKYYKVTVLTIRSNTFNPHLPLPILPLRYPFQVTGRIAPQSHTSEDIWWNRQGKFDSTAITSYGSVWYQPFFGSNDVVSNHIRQLTSDASLIWFGSFLYLKNDVPQNHRYRI